MAGCEVEVTLFNQQLLHARKHLRGIVVIQVRDQHADEKALPLAQRTGKEAGPVVELGRCFGYTVARLLRNGTDTGRVVQNLRDGRRRKVSILTECAQADGLSRLRLGSRFGAWAFTTVVTPCTPYAQ